MSKQRKKAFTLLEMLIAFVLLTCASIGGISIYNASQKTKFQTSIQRLQEKIRAAHALAQITYNAVDVVFEKKETGIGIAIAAYQDISPAIQKELARPEVLNGILSIEASGSDIFSEAPLFYLPVYPSGITYDFQTLTVTPIFKDAYVKIIELQDVSSFETITNETQVKEDYPNEALSKEK
jgi:type II secretory pathway pseudopilin PulG